MTITSDYSWLEALPDGAIIVSSQGVVTFANRLARDILQTNPIGLTVTSVIRASAFSAALLQVTKSGGSVSVDIEFYSRLQRLVNVHLAKIDKTLDILVVLRDLTREQAIEKMRSDFVANASHEMRTPLAAVIGSIETLQGAAKDDPKARVMFLNTMLSQAQRMKRLIDDLLTLSRIELNEHVRPSNKISLASIVTQAKASLIQQAASMNVSLELTTQGSVDVSGDRDELLQVALNLIENAIKYGSQGGRIEITCETKGKDGVFAVRDFGQGIAKDHIPRLTERFYRVSNKESRARGGTGLGLAICKHIINRHRGRLEITSELEKGSLFSVTLPLTE